MSICFCLIIKYMKFYNTNMSNKEKYKKIGKVDGIFWSPLLDLNQ